MADLEIKIKTMADLAALEQTTQKTASLIAAVGGEATATKGATEEVKKSVKTHSESGEAAQKLGLKHKELNKVVHELGHEFPILGEAARLALHPQITLALGVVTGFTLLKKHIEEVQAAMKGGDWTTVTGYLAEQAKVAHEASQDMKTLATELQNISTAEEKIRDRANEAITAMKNQFALADKLRGAQKDFKTEQIEKNFKTGKISAEEAERQKNQLADKAIDDELQSRLTQANEELRIRRAEHDQLTAKISSYDPAIQADSATKTNARQRVPVSEKTLSRDLGALGRNEKDEDIDAQGNVLRKNNKGEFSGKRTGELGKLDQLKEDLQKYKAALASMGGTAESNVNNPTYQKHAGLVKETQDAHDAQEKYVAQVEKVIALQRARLVRLADTISAADKKFTEDSGKKKADQSDDKELTDKVIPEILQRIKDLEFERSQIVPVRKATENVRSEGRIFEIQKEDKEKQDRENARQKNKAEDDYPDHHSRRSGGGDFDPDRDGRGERALATATDKGVQASSRATEKSIATAKQIADSGKEISDHLKGILDPTLEAMQSLAADIQSVRRDFQTQIAQLKNQFKTGRV